MVNDERARAAGEVRASEDVVTAGNGNGRADDHQPVRVGGGVPRGLFAASPSSVTIPGPAVPLVPPTRPTRPVAPTPLGRSGTTAPVRVVPATEPTDGETASPTPPAPARLRPPVRTRLARRPRVRKVSRVVRRIDAWSVFKVALVFWAIVFLILLIAGMILWNLAESTGTITNVEGFIKDLFGLRTFEFEGGQILRSAWIIGAVLVVGGTATSVTLVVLFNLISDLLGGVRVTVLEEEVVLRAVTPAAAPEPAIYDEEAGTTPPPASKPSPNNGPTARTSSPTPRVRTRASD